MQLIKIFSFYLIKKIDMQSKLKHLSNLRRDHSYSQRHKAIKL